MIWHIVLLLLAPVAALIGRLMSDDRGRNVLALRQKVLILQHRLGKRPLSLGAEGPGNFQHV